MFRKMRRSKQELTKEECIEILKKKRTKRRAFRAGRGWISLWNAYDPLVITRKMEKSISTEQNLVIRLMPSKIVTKFHSVLWTRDIERKENGH